MGVTDVTFNLNYNPNLLNISGTLSGTAGTFTSGVRDGWRGQFRIPQQHGSHRQFDARPNRRPGARQRRERLQGQGAFALLEHRRQSGAITAVGKDGIHVNAYLGDVTGIGTLSAARCVADFAGECLLDSGFAAYPLLDPSIIGDVSGSGNLTGADVTLMNRCWPASATRQIPADPHRPDHRGRPVPIRA